MLNNCVFVRNLSEQATEQKLREEFQGADQVLAVKFHIYPGTDNVYAQVFFATSGGVTHAINHMNGKSFLGVPMTYPFR